MPITEEVIDIEARHSIFVQRYATTLTNQFSAVIQELKTQISLRLIEAGPAEQMIKDIEAIQRHIYQNYEEALNTQFMEFAQSEMNFEQDVHLRTGGKSPLRIPPDLWKTITTDPLVFQASDQTVFLEPFIKNWSDDEIRRVSNIIRTGTLIGETNADIAKKIAGNNGTLDRITRRNNNAVIRTSLNHISNQSKKALYEANQDVVIGHEWVSKIDSRTSDICRSLDGTKYYYNRDGAILYPPAHPNCRSTIAPITR